jgi:hypothetical protein
MELLQEGLHGTGLQDKVTAGGAVTGNVAKSPNGLLPNVVIGGHQQPDEDGDCANLNDDLGVVGGAGRDLLALGVQGIYSSVTSE